ncbi:MAG: sulfite exporter TauE/SafE family protein [Opitutaceae bacterium]|nr:sulfite exporter TauE/SafE family protein [Cytophagales bacterium]
MFGILTIIFIVSYLAFSLSAICGGGAGLMLIPVLGRILPVSQVPAALSIGTFISSVSRVFVFFAKIRWDIVKWFVPAALPAVWLGAWLLKFVNPIYLELSMGLFLISNLFSLFRVKKEIAVGNKSNFKLLIIGFLAGFLSGLTGAVGLLFNKFYLHYGLSKEEIVATRAANEVLMHLLKIVLYTLFGLISYKVLSVGLTVAISALLSTWTMKWILPRLSELLFKYIGYSAMVLSGFVMLSQSGQTIFNQNKGNLSFKPIAEGIETKLQWQKSNFSIEFAYDDGFEYEQQIPFLELDDERKLIVLKQKNLADKIIIEEVYGMGSKSYEAYYFKNNKLDHQIDFN